MSPGPRRLNLRRPDTCAVCARGLAVGEAAVWDPDRRHARCLGCEPAPTESFAGASARREYERRRDRREARVRERVGPFAGVVLALSGEPTDQRNWARGAEGEVELARKLERWTADDGVLLIHDRRLPGSRANIDHLAIGPSGITVIDAKRYKGRIAVERRGGPFNKRTEHLLVGGRDRTKLVDGVLGQVGAVQRTLAGGAHAAVPVRAALCFVDGNWPWKGGLGVRGVPVLGPRGASRLCSVPGPFDAAAVEEIAELLVARLAPA